MITKVTNVSTYVLTFVLVSGIQGSFNCSAFYFYNQRLTDFGCYVIDSAGLFVVQKPIGIGE